MLQALKMKLANMVRTQAELATEAKFRAVLEELAALRLLVERSVRSADNEHRDMDETQRMIGVACARIENFIKLQNDHRAVMEQSIASLLPDRVR